MNARAPTVSKPALAHKVVVVTGSSHGIGRAVALRLAKEGARVVVNGSGTGQGGPAACTSALEQLLGEISAEGGEGAPFVGSVANDTEARGLIETAVQTYGRLDGLVNCAGIAEPPGSSARGIRYEDWERIRRVHLDGTFSCCRHALPHLVAAGGGRIVNTTSHAHLGLYGGSAYGAAKGGINSLTWELAADYAADGIRCNAIAPGAKTRLSSGPEYEAQIADLEARGVLSAEMAAISLAAPPAEGCASLYAFLLGDAAAEITGQIFSATGGYVGVFPKPAERMLVYRAGDEPWSIEALAERLPRALERQAEEARRERSSE